MIEPFLVYFWLSFNWQLNGMLLFLICLYVLMASWSGILFHRLLRTKNLMRFMIFFNLLYSPSIGGLERDRMAWKHSGSKKFTVRSFYKVLTVQDGSFPQKCIWRSCAFKYHFFHLEVSQEDTDDR